MDQDNQKPAKAKIDVEVVQQHQIEHEDRIDDFAAKAFQTMGYKRRLSDNMVLIYKDFKLRKDRLQPGRLTPEGLAFVSVLAEMADGNLNLKSKE